MNAVHASSAFMRARMNVLAGSLPVPGLFFLRASSLDDPEVFRPQMVVYTSSGATWDLVDAELPAFETMPPADTMPV